jgi:hypothetical protein
MTKSRGILSPRSVWTDDHLQTLRSTYPRFRTEDIATLLGHPLGRVYRKANQLGLKKSAEFVAAQSARQMERFDHPARDHRFEKGHASWNKGTKGVAGVQAACRATQFKPGQHPFNTLPIGSTKLDKSQVLLQKVSDAKGNNSKRWRGVHELVWIAANGPLPPKHIVVFRPGMKTNVLEEITIDKVECISQADNMRRNTVHNLPKELVPLVRLRAVLTRSINRREKNVTAENH